MDLQEHMQALQAELAALSARADSAEAEAQERSARLEALAYSLCLDMLFLIL